MIKQAHTTLYISPSYPEVLGLQSPVELAVEHVEADRRVLAQKHLSVEGLLSVLHRAGVVVQADQ